MRGKGQTRFENSVRMCWQPSDECNGNTEANVSLDPLYLRLSFPSGLAVFPLYLSSPRVSNHQDAVVAPVDAPVKL